ncbi:unnamed protein product, partial [Tetraodon nigroviridis]
MDFYYKLGFLLFLLKLPRFSAVFIKDNCTDYELQFNKVFSVPGDVAMLNSSLLTSSVFNFSAVPYNITWYQSATGKEMTNQTSRILVRGETLWFLNVTKEDAGKYVTTVRTPTWCYRQSTKLVVDQPSAGCGRPRTVGKDLTNGVPDRLSCPLNDYITKLNSYNVTSSITWYKDCEAIENRNGRYTYMKTKLMIAKVTSEDHGLYTCTLTFTLNGVTGSVSETIDAEVTVEYSLTPQVHEPANEIIKAELDSDGKLYDAYVAYPSPCSSGYNTDVENFAIHTLPQVLEKACGYKLFIAGRDCLPGQ